jgi:acetyl esterase/lipase
VTRIKDLVKALLLASLINAEIFSQNPSYDSLIRLWAETAPEMNGVRPDDIPTIALYLPVISKAMGSAIVICPSGSSSALTEKEVRETIEWLKDLGIAVVLLKYRIGARYGYRAPMTDAARAIRLLRTRAAEWRIDPNRIGIIGSLVGGHVASTVATRFDEGTPNAADPIERVSSRPNVLILCNPVITMTLEFGHNNSRKSLLGDNPSQDLINYFSSEKHVSSKTPPAFLYHADGDHGVSAENSRLFAAALQKAKVPYELHICDKAKDKACTIQNDSTNYVWKPLLERWLYARGFLTQARASYESDVTKKRQIPSEIESLIGEVRSVLPEFAANALLRIIESAKIRDTEWKEELIEEAFYLAAKSQYPVKRNYLPGSSIDTREGYLSYAFELKLDVLSLQCRAVRAMLLVNKHKARDLFSRISQPKLPGLKCEDALTYDVTDFYDTLKEITQKTFTPEEMSNDEHVSFVVPYISNIDSPLQVGPLARMIQGLKLTAPRLDLVVRLFSDALRKISGDDRSFSYAMGASRAGQEIGQLVAVCKQQNVTCDDLLEAYRDYLVKHLSANRCADNVTRNGELFRVPGYVDWFNKSMRLDSSANILPISTDDAKPSKVEGSAKLYHYWQTPRAKKLLQGIRDLRFGPSEKQSASSETRKQAQPLSLPERESLSWNRMLVEFLNDLQEWKPEHEASNADYFHQKCVLLEGLVVLAPPGPMRQRVLGEYLIFLRLNRFQIESRTEWLFHVRSLISRFSSGDGRRSILGALKDSSDPILELYASLEEQFPQSAEVNRQDRSAKQ